MTPGRWKTVARTWLGLLSAASMVFSALWLLSSYTHARFTDPREKALVEALKEKAKEDAGVQGILQPELDRQHREIMARRRIYDIGGLVFLISGGTFLAWVKWLRPAPGAAAGVPEALARLLEQQPGRAAEAAPSQPRVRESDDPVLQAYLSSESSAAPETMDLSQVDEIVRNEGSGPDAVIPILQAIQSHFRYLPAHALRRVCELTEISPARISGVASFYSQFRTQPVGEHLIRLCEGTACHVSGASEIREELCRILGIRNGSDSDPGRHFTLERVACVGSCSLAPVISIDERVYGRLDALSMGEVLKEFLRQTGNGCKGLNGGRAASELGLRAQPGTSSGDAVEIRVGLGSCGLAGGALAVTDAIEESLRRMGGGAFLKEVGCNGLCHQEPMIEIIQNRRSTLYGEVTPADVSKILHRHIRPRGLLARARREIAEARARLSEDRAWVPAPALEIDPEPYLKRQVRVVLENCGIIDPLSLDEYLQHQGMRALEKCLRQLSPEQVIETVQASGLRGRGGAGFQTAVKWRIARNAVGPGKYVICNGDEGDPGAFADRAVLEADPYRVIEGLVIAAFAVGANEGFVYVRREYPVAVRHVRTAIRRAEERGFLGENILGSGFSFKLGVREGAGAFVCGEETALIQSIEGERGMPRLRPPYPAQAGLWGKPTVINNVETLACLPWIFRRGPESFASLGTSKSRGTKVFSLAGKVRRGGLIEVPMGITIREIVEEIGGGIKDGRKFKAVLIGGPSGGCIPASLADTRVDYEELTSTGAIMGSGGLVVLDDSDCAVEIARYFLHFTQNESCGKCTFCRVGTRRMLEILERICGGSGIEADLKTLEELGRNVKTGSLCGLGQTAPNPVLTTLMYFREEYEAHIRERRCPAAQCKAMIHFRVLDSCTGCTLCAQACPAGAIEMRPYQMHEVFDEKCTRCGMCLTACTEDAIMKISGLPTVLQPRPLSQGLKEASRVVEQPW